MAGYTRQDTANNIANGSVIDADDLDGEFNAVESAFNASSGHSHDGSSGQGAPVTKVGPGQDIIVGTSTLLPKANNIIDLGSSAAQFKDGYFDGILYTDTANIGVNGYTTIVDNSYTVSNGDLTLDVVGDITLDADGGDVLLKDGGVSFGKLSNNSNQLSIYSGNVEALRLNGSATSALGTLAVTGNTTVGGTLAITGNTTIATANITLNSGNIVVGGTVSATGGFTGALTGNVTGNVTGTVSSIANHSTDTLSEGSSNLYHTTARARGAISATGSLSYNNSTGVMSFTQGNTDTIAEGSTNLYHTTARARGAISATGNISYNSSTGVISLATNQDVTFDDVIVGGNLTVNGTTTTVNSNTVNIGDNIITLNSDETGTPSQDAGITIERGTSANKSLVWTESTDKWGVGSETFVAGTFEGNLTGNVTGAVTGNASTATALATARNIALTGDVSGNVNFDGSGNVSIASVIANDSHTHDDRYFTETESDTRFTASGGDTMTGSLKFNDNVKAVFGTDDDVDMHYDNSHMYMDLKTGTSNFYIRDNTTNIFTFNDNGNFTASGNVTAYSDERLKSNIVTIPNALETVCKLRGVNFIKDGLDSTGVIAQEVQKVIPEVVLEGEEYLSVAYGNLVGVLIEAVKELKEEVQQLKDGSI